MSNTYKNQVKIHNEKDEDMTDEELKIYDYIEDKVSEMLVRHGAEVIAYTLKMYLKYGRIDNCSYEVMANSILDARAEYKIIPLATIVSKIVLKDKYNVDIVQDKPLILSTNIPLNEITEEY